MFLDYRERDVSATVRCDLCIVGAGAAGIALALALANSGLDICMVESGGFEYDDAVQMLYAGESIGLQNADPLNCRVRYFGGTTSRWQGWCAPLQEIDFAARPWIPHSGWPIARSDLDPYYTGAWDLCEVQPRDAALDALPRFDPAKIRTELWHFSPPTRFGARYRDQLGDAPHISVMLNCNAVKIETNARASEVKQLHVAALTGKTGSIKAGAYVLACGGMENTRLLLLTDDIERGGLGNRSGTLGRFFTQHIELAGAQVYATDAAQLAELFELHRDDSVRAHVSTATDAQRSLGLLNTGFSFGSPEQYSSGFVALRDLWRELGSGAWPDDFGRKVGSVASDLDSVARDIFITRNSEPPYLKLGVYGEQTPNPDSRIGLGKTKDPFGLPRIRVDWRLSATDRRSILQSVHNLAEELGRLKMGRIKMAEWLVNEQAPWPQPIWSGCHHMGTTRMSLNSDSGVVNPDCRVHGVGNLYIAGSSVFPTGGYVPPTLTILALALRLGDHLRERYG